MKSYLDQAYNKTSRHVTHANIEINVHISFLIKRKYSNLFY